MIYIFLADGFEEIEALAPLDILRRADLEVKTVGIGAKTIIGAHNIPVVCDITANEAKTQGLEAVILPGGMPGTLNLEKDETVNKFIAFAAENNLLIGAICAAPSILGHKGLLNNKKATCFPSFETELIGAEVLAAPIARDGNIITSRGAGTAMDFGFEIMAYFKDRKTADELKKSMQCY